MKITNHINSPKKFNVEELIEHLSTVLQISSKAELTIMYNDKLLNQLSKGEI